MDSSASATQSKLPQPSTRDPRNTSPPIHERHAPASQTKDNNKQSSSSGNSSAAPVASPGQSRDPSPSPHLLSPTTLHIPQDQQQPSPNPLAAPSRRQTPSTSPLKQTSSRPSSPFESSSKTHAAGRATDKIGPDAGTKHWPASPRLTSPAASRRNSASSVTPTTKQYPDMDSEDNEGTPKAGRAAGPPPSSNRSRSPPPASPPASGAKPPRQYNSIASTLETVEEGDLGTSPNDERTAGASNTAAPAVQMSTSATHPDLRSLDTSQELTETEGDSGRSRDLSRQTPNKQVTQSQPPPLSKAKKPGSALNLLAKARSAHENSANSMTVETETVPSIPQASSSVLPADKGAAGGKKDDSGSLRAKQSTETIRPKKARKRAPPKRTSVVSGSKAEIFEAKVSGAASDEDTDSEETFVYESNPPETRPRQHRHHSRTPSGASVQSIADRRHGGRVVSNVLDSHRGPKQKRSMKFASSSQVAGSGDEDPSGREYGTVRAHKHRPTRLDDPTFQRHHGPWNAGSFASNGQDSLFSSPTLGSGGEVRSDRASPRVTPRSSPPPYSRISSKAQNEGYDLGHQVSEQDPLMGPLRSTPRSRPSRHMYSSDIRNNEHLGSRRRPWTRRCSGVLIFTTIFLVILIAAAGLLFATTSSMYNVTLLDIQNVVASEEELMLDLNVAATNPNIFSISTSEIDINIFAKSRHVGTDSYWRRHGAPEPIRGNPSGITTGPAIGTPESDRSEKGDEEYSEDATTTDWWWGGHNPNRDDGTDPPSDGDLEGDPHIMLLGRILHFDSPVTFPASPFLHHAHNSTGSLRLQKPGNHTETGGSERWELVLKHPFSLIVKGVFRYRIPISTGHTTASIGATVAVDPDNTSTPPKKERLYGIPDDEEMVDGVAEDAERRAHRDAKDLRRERVNLPT